MFQTTNEFVEDASSLAESILASIADAVIFADDAGTIRRWNRAAADLFGYSPPEALGQSQERAAVGARGAVAVARDVTARMEQQRANALR